MKFCHRGLVTLENAGMLDQARSRVSRGRSPRSSQKAMKITRSRSFWAMWMAVSRGLPWSWTRWAMRRLRWSRYEL